MKSKESYKIIIDRDLCIGAAPCTIFAPNTFELDSEGKAVVKDTKGDDYDKILEAAKSCPVLAIIIENDKGEKIYPK